MKKPFGVLIAILTVGLFVASGALGGVIRMAAGLSSLALFQPSLSLGGSIVGKILAHAISFAAVGFAFRKLGFFDSRLMRIAYPVASLITGFVLSWGIAGAEALGIAVAPIACVIALGQFVKKIAR